MKKLFKQLTCIHKWVELPPMIHFQRWFFVEKKCNKCDKTKVKFK